ncbi:uncharacterized protein At3g27210-like [Juglans microcarpa x Juglans regia]|uniref:uncharacterized protein At3g27210-like n=1 Tax=Juglans microcarpa x Juglans regia TaxID=2249226 RepID=UPI001B7E5BD4|nr:uncharacterized protein At3g27210-like [Juglans microcarpa x Juglans regia]
MGSCASLHRSSDSAMKLRLSFGSKDDKLVIPPSPIKEIPTKGNPPIDNNNVVAAKSQWSASRSAASFGGYGSKEETFFDSQAWLDSDCDDDFFSVNGDFTPSRGNTPVHQNFSTGMPRVTKVLFEADRILGSTHEPSPKKKLIELFRESIRQDQDVDNLNTSGNQNISNGKMEVKPTVLDLPPKSAHGTPYGTNSVCSSERTPSGDLLTEKEKPFRPVQCCLPSLISCHSFRERKKKMDPAIAVVD